MRSSTNRLTTFTIYNSDAYDIFVNIFLENTGDFAKSPLFCILNDLLHLLRVTRSLDHGYAAAAGPRAGSAARSSAQRAGRAVSDRGQGLAVYSGDSEGGHDDHDLDAADRSGPDLRARTLE